MIDFVRLNQITSPSERKLRAEEAFRAAGEIALSDVLIQRTPAAQLILELMAEEARTGRIDPETGRRAPGLRRKFKIRCLRDQWGEPIKPGTVVEWKAGIKRKNALGVKFTTRDMNDLRRKGMEDEFLEIHAAKVDENGCIDLEFADAGMLLGSAGIHYANGAPICAHREISTKPKKGPDGTMRHRHYWLYEEVPPGVEPSAPPTRRKRKSVLVD